MSEKNDTSSVSDAIEPTDIAVEMHAGADDVNVYVTVVARRDDRGHPVGSERGDGRGVGRISRIAVARRTFPPPRLMLTEAMLYVTWWAFTQSSPSRTSLSAARIQGAVPLQ